MNNKQTYQDYLTAKLQSLDDLLNKAWCTSVVYVSRDIYDVKDTYKGRRKIELDETLANTSFRVDSLYNIYKGAIDENVTIDLKDLDNPQLHFTKEEYAVMDKLVHLGKAAFNSMAKRYRDNSPDVERLYDSIKGKLMVKTLL